MRDLPPFSRHLFDPAQRLSRLGGGELGGKAHGLRLADEVLARHGAELGGLGFHFDVPALVVLGTDLFDAFLDRNGLRDRLADGPADEAVKLAFQQAAMPAELAGDFAALAGEARVPLAVRSSSLLEDALGQPFAGVYGTKMIPGNQVQAPARLRTLLDAVKFVWASTFFAEARSYRQATRRPQAEEKMAVLVQEVVGRPHGPRFYPDVSGVARSLNFYPQGRARPEDGIVHLALGLGKTIVDGEPAWSFSPPHPEIGPPFGSVRELVGATQTRFWAVNVGPPPAYDPMTETEYLIRPELSDAEADGTLRWAASTYDPASDRLVPGTGRPGPRVLTFAPLLVYREIPLAVAVRTLLDLCQEALASPVEIEFALSLPEGGPRRFGFLQVRPLTAASEPVEVDEAELSAPDAVVASRSALGNGRSEISDLVYVDPEDFSAAETPAIAEEIAALNRELREERRPYLLIGFGRWGSSEPWLGIPVRWDQISGARVIVEAALPAMNPEPSQGSHFFHNLSSFEVCYLMVPVAGDTRGLGGIDWNWIRSQPARRPSAHVRHVRLTSPLAVAVDGRTGRGVVRRLEAP